MIRSLWNDEAGVILSAELVLIGTILVVGMIVGLVELQCSVVDELNDLGEAVGAINQSYEYSGILSLKGDGTIKAASTGSAFADRIDSCDGNECNIVCVAGDAPEAPKSFGN
jgi:Flp pilus assembly pilin Flp